ncbi:hypothetical protein FS749_000939 [Ceratobasidium sp. UAMH 11750]|nr:hypothetical protein FS749_000939 [Ceratobasidium sp. UAMH 11750]
MTSSSHFPSSSRSYQLWKASRDSLSLAIRSYTNACNNLSSDYESELLQLPSDSRFTHHRLAEFETELSSLPQEEERLLNARASLLHFRNGIPTIVKIHRLPHDILAQIFLALHHDWITTRDKEEFPVLPSVLSSVCHVWRSISMALPALWSCIDIAVDAPNSDAYFEWAQLWAARSNAALSVHIWHSSEADSDTLDVSESGISGLISFLTPTASRIRHLKLDCYLVSDVPQYAMACIVNFGMPGHLSTLDLEVEECDMDPLEFLPLMTPTQLEKPLKHRIDDFLRPVTKLTLTSVLIPWESAVYSNLVELVISFTNYGDDYTHELADLARVLESSPQLRVISLRDHDFFEDDYWTAQTPPIYLRDLQSLTLSSTGMEGCSSLLPLFGPGPNPLYFEIRLEEDSTFEEELEAFFSRSNVTTLWVKTYNKQAWFSALGYDLDQLESLTLDECDFSDPDLAVFLEEEWADPTASPLPNLSSLRLRDCRIEADVLEQLLAVYSIRWLRIDYTSSFNRLERSEEDLMIGRLQKLVPDIVVL